MDGQPFLAPEEFGDEVIGDNVMVLKQTDRSMHGDTTVLTIYDRATCWLEGHPAATKSKTSAILAPPRTSDTVVCTK